jgi:UDP-N-acetylmuramate-alanine ligase
MKREQLILQSRRFTSTSALAREVVALLEASDYALLIEVSPSEKEMLDSELESVRAMSRVKVEVIA